MQLYNTMNVYRIVSYTPQSGVQTAEQQQLIKIQRGNCNFTSLLPPFMYGTWLAL